MGDNKMNDKQMGGKVGGYTPGPWRVGDAGVTVFGPPNGNPAPKRIADMAKTPEYKANARLIAAAPELLEALEALLADKYLADPINADRMAQARAALANARGI